MSVAPRAAVRAFLSCGVSGTAVLLLALAATPAKADCAVTRGGRVTCDHNTTTENTTNRDGRRANSNSRTQHFDNGKPIDATVAPGVGIRGAGLALTQTRPGGAPQAITLTNDGTIAAHIRGRAGTVGLSGDGGAVVYQGRGSVTSTVGSGIVAENSGDITITADGAVSGGTATKKPNRNGRTPTPPAIEANGTGKGDIVVGGSGAVSGPAGRGIVAQETMSGTGSVLVTGSGDTAGRGQICPGVNPASVKRTGETGCSGIRAVILNARDAGDVTVNRSGNVSGTSAAINAITAGTGNVAVTTGTNARIAGRSEFGIEASAKGAHSAGSIAVKTGTDGTLRSGGDGIFAQSLARAIPVAAGSRIDIDAAGRIVSGTFALAHLNKKDPEGVLAGISAGYLGGPMLTPNAAVHGTVDVRNAATIDAQSGDGIFGYNLGHGALSVSTRTRIDAQAGDGIATQATKGPTRVDLVGPDAAVTAGGAGHSGLVAKATGGGIDVDVGAGAVLRGIDGAAGATLNGAGSQKTITNLGTIAGRVGIVGSGLKIVNEGSIASDAHGAGAYAVVLTGGVNSISGAGMLGGVDVTGASTLSAPALAIDGPLRFASTATYKIALSASGAAPADVTGTATLGGAALDVVTRGRAPKPGSRTTILTATDGVRGRFSSVTSDLAFLAPTLRYGADKVSLDADYDYRLPGGTANETRVGSGLDVAAALDRGGTAAAIFQGLRAVPAGEGASVLDSLSGEGITAAQSTALRSSQLFTSTIFDQTTFYGASGNSITLADALPLLALRPAVRELADPTSQPATPATVAPGRTWRVWSTGFGGGEDLHGTEAAGTAGQESTIYGGTLGVDYQVTPGNLLGVAIGGSDAAFAVAARSTTGSTTGGHVAIYDLATFGSFYGASSAAFSFFSNQTTRAVAGFGAVAGETERGAFNSDEFRARLEAGRHIDGYGYEVTPFAALEVAALRSNGFAETPLAGPGLLGLDVAGQTTTSVPTFLGLRLRRALALGDGMVLTPTLQASYVHEFSPDRQETADLAALPGSTFLVDGARAARNAAEVKVGGELTLGRHVAVFANFDSELSGAGTLYAAKGGVRYVW